MNSSAPEALSSELLIYQNKQLSRLVRSLRSKLNERSQSPGIETPGRSSDPSHESPELERLTLRIKQLETRIHKYSLKGHISHSRLLDDPQASHAFTSIERASPTDSGEPCDKCGDYTRLATAFAIASSRLEHTEHVDPSVCRNDAKKSGLDESSLWVAKLSDTDRLLSTLQQDMGLRVAQYERMLEEQSQKFHCELTTPMHFPPEERRGGIVGPSDQPTKMESSDSTVAIQDLINDLDNQMIASSQKLRDSLRSKEEQLSRALMQLVQQQVLMNDTEKENNHLRDQLAIGESLKNAAASLEDRWSSLIERSTQHEAALVNEIVTRNGFLYGCIGDLNRCGDELAKADACNRNLENVTKCLQSQLDEATREIAQVKRMRLGGASVQAGSTLMNMEMENIKQKIKCTLCGLRDKSVTLTTCMHCFCRECVNQQMIAARNRKCPLCNQRFADAEVRDVHFLQS